MKTTGVVVSNSEFNKTQLLIAKLIDENKKLKALSGTVDPKVEKELFQRERLLKAKEVAHEYNEQTFDSGIAKYNLHLHQLPWWLKKLINIKKYLYY